MEPEPVQIGLQHAWGDLLPFGLSGADRFRHLYIVGQTGTGKSTLLRELMAQDLKSGEGCALLDPHGDLADTLLRDVPRHRIDDVIVFDPSDIDFPVAFNPFYRVAIDDRPLVAANLTSTFKHIWADSWGPRLEYILQNTFRALLDAPDHLRPSFLGVPRVFVDRDYRDAVKTHIKDEGARRFFVDEYSRWNERMIIEALSPLQNKIGALVANPFVRNVLCQWKPTVDLSRIMQKQQILIVRLPKGSLGEEASHLLGALVVSGAFQAAMSRLVENRVPFHLYVDEFPNFANRAFELLLSEARKFQISLTMGHQYLDQLSPELRSAVFGNVGSIVTFRVGARDADALANELGRYNALTYREMGRGEIIARMVRNGQTSQPVRGQTVPTPALPRHCKKVRANSRRAYARPRAKVEARIAQWLQKRNDVRKAGS